MCGSAICLLATAPIFGIIAAVLYKYLWLDDQESATVPVRRAIADVEPIAAAPETRRSASQSRRGRRR